jgi:hypothetical protein
MKKTCHHIMQVRKLFKYSNIIIFIQCKQDHAQDHEEHKNESKYLLNKLQSPAPVGPLSLNGMNVRRIQSGKNQ